MRKLLLSTALICALPAMALAQTISQGATTSAPSADTMAGPSPTATGAMSPANGSTSNATLNLMDKKFIKMAAIAGMSEVQEGQLAQSKGDDSVKQLGARMVTDHTKANNELIQISQSLANPAPAMQDATHKAQAKSLQAMSGTAFDNAYLSDQLKAHEEAVALFKKEINSGSNEQLKNFAQTTLPIIEDHLAMIKTAAQT